MGTARPGGAWLAFRAVLAVGLTVGFSALALGLAGLLLWLAWFQVSSADRASVHLVLACIVAGGAILWGVLPRPERFEAPGPLLSDRDQPRLFRELRSIASAVGQEMPAEVYLVHDVNAGVLQRGGMLGFGGRRVMVLGLPLLTVLRVSEFRAVLAHEFGHYLGGETRLGPWIYRTQQAIMRTVRTLAEARSHVRVLFVWYGKAFLRITLAISRRQELAADRLAAEVAGAPAAAAGLRRVHGAGAAFGPYIGQEVLPVISSGFRPPLSEGFARFLGAGTVAASVAGFVEAQVREGRGDPYDSHPPLRARLQALGDPPVPEPSAGDPPAVSLLEGLDGLEARLLQGMLPGRPLLPAIPWGEAGAKVHLPRWRKQVAENLPLLRGLTPASLPGVLSRPAGDPRWRRLADPPPAPKGPPKLALLAAMAIVLALLERGWTLRLDPGKEPAVVRGDESFFPFREVGDLAAGATSAAGWIERCRALGIEGLPLDAPAGA